VLCLGGNPPRLDRVQKTTPIVLCLVGVNHREFCDRFVELAVIAHIARQCDRIARPRIRACQGTAAQSSVERQLCLEASSDIGEPFILEAANVKIPSR